MIRVRLSEIWANQPNFKSEQLKSIRYAYVSLLFWCLKCYTLTIALRRKPSPVLADSGYWFWILDNFGIHHQWITEYPASSIQHLPYTPQRFIPEALQKFSVTPLPIGFDAAISVLTKDRMSAEYGARALWWCFLIFLPVVIQEGQALYSWHEFFFYIIEKHSVLNSLSMMS